MVSPIKNKYYILVSLCFHFPTCSPFFIETNPTLQQRLGLPQRTWTWVASWKRIHRWLVWYHTSYTMSPPCPRCIDSRSPRPRKQRPADLANPLLLSTLASAFSWPLKELRARSRASWASWAIPCELKAIRESEHSLVGVHYMLLSLSLRRFAAQLPV